MNKKIIENNILIAEFLGGEIVLWEAKDRLGDDIENDTYYVYFPGLFGGISVEDLNYHEDWNWLMQVVEKIENLKPISFLSGRNWIGFDVKIYKTFNTQTHYCTIKYLKEGGDMTIANGFSKITKIEAVYNACTEFIKWVNNESK